MQSVAATVVMKNGIFFKILAPFARIRHDLHLAFKDNTVQGIILWKTFPK